MIKICDKTAFGLPEEQEIINLSQDSCPVAWALNVAATANLNTCGKGTFCRDGINQLWQIIRDITIDKGKNDDMELLKELCDMILLANDCELSEKTARLLLASLAVHRNEWEAHLYRKKCSALVCSAYYTVHINPMKCDGCGQCMPVCPVCAIAGDDNLIHVVDNQICTKCNKCFAGCPQDAFIKAGSIKPRIPEFPVPVGSFSANVRRRRRSVGEDASEE